jgi:hypothetical protein
LGPKKIPRDKGVKMTMTPGRIISFNE